MALITGRAGHARAKIYPAANTARTHVTGGGLVAVVADRSVGGDRVAAGSRPRITATSYMTLVAASAGHRRAEIYPAAHAARTYITGGRRVAVVAGSSIARRRITADAGTRITAAGYMTLVAGRAGHCRAKIGAAANPAYALVARRNGIAVVAGCTVGRRRVAAGAR